MGMIIVLGFIAIVVVFMIAVVYFRRNKTDSKNVGNENPGLNQPQKEKGYYE